MRTRLRDLAPRLLPLGVAAVALVGGVAWSAAENYPHLAPVTVTETVAADNPFAGARASVPSSRSFAGATGQFECWKSPTLGRIYGCRAKK